MTQETERYIDIAQRVSAAAQGGTLKAETAVQFCQHLLPSLLVELEIARRIDMRLSERITAPQECEATICSSRWPRVAAEKAAERAAAKAKNKKARKPRKRKEVRDDATAS